MFTPQRLPDIDVPLNYRYDQLPELINGINSNGNYFGFQPGCPIPTIIGTVVSDQGPASGGNMIVNSIYGNLTSTAGTGPTGTNGLPVSAEIAPFLAIQFSSIGTNISYSSNIGSSISSSAYNYLARGVYPDGTVPDNPVFFCSGDGSHFLGVNSVISIAVFGIRATNFFKIPANGPFLPWPYLTSGIQTYSTSALLFNPLCASYKSGLIRNFGLDIGNYNIQPSGAYVSNISVPWWGTNNPTLVLSNNSAFVMNYAGGGWGVCYSKLQGADIETPFFVSGPPSSPSDMSLQKTGNGFITCQSMGASNSQILNNTYVYNDNMTLYAKLNFRPVDTTAAYILSNRPIAVSIDQFGLPIVVSTGDGSSTLPNYAFAVLAPLSVSAMFQIPTLLPPLPPLVLSCLKDC